MLTVTIFKLPKTTAMDVDDNVMKIRGRTTLVTSFAYLKII